MRIGTRLLAVLLGVAALAASAFGLGASAADPRYFPETGHYLANGFKAFWERSGGLMVFGYPLTEEFTEHGLTVQYVERQRFEYHPEHRGTPYEVELGLLGRQAAERQGLLASAPFRPIAARTDASCEYVAQTGHRLCHGFKSYWHSHGLEFGDRGISSRESLALFGYPISEEFRDPQTGLTVQYFERARFEYHPANPDPYKVLLGRLGADLVPVERVGVESLPNGGVGATVLGVVSGDDWRLPGGLAPAAHSGLYGYNNSSLVPGKPVMATWAQLNPAPGAYDWSSIDSLLAKGTPIVLRLKCGSPSDVPGYVRAQHPSWPTFTNAEGDVELAQWLPGWLDAWQPFIQALGARYKGNAGFVGLQLQITADGEPGTKSDDVLQFERLTGLSPTTLESFLRDYYSRTLSAFAGSEWKVFSVMKPYFITSRYSGPYSAEQYAQAVRRATFVDIPAGQTRSAFARGLGIRGSGVAEQYEAAADWAEWSQIVGGVLVTHDATFPPLVTRGHVDGQLENYYGSNRSSQVTTTDPATVRYALRLSLLRAVADQYSYLWLDGDDAAFVGGDLVGWVRQELGRRPADAPDAFLLLGQFGDLQAMPRWLTPLGLAGTSPGPAVDTSGLGFVSASESLGRRLSQPLSLAVDDRFLAPGGSHDVEVVVTYLADGARFCLEYDGADGLERSPSLGDSGGGWRSVTLRLPDARFAARLAGGADLRLVPESGSPTIQLIRVIR